MQDEIRSVKWTTRAFFYLCAAFCVSFFIWAAVSPLDIVSNAMGEVVPSSKVKRIQHLEGGIVRALKVREGDTVTVDQPLIELEATASDSTVEELNVRVASLKVEMLRLEAESRWFDGGGKESVSPMAVDPFEVTPVFPGELGKDAPDMVAQAKELYNARRERFVNDIKAQEEQIKQRQQDIKEITARIRNQQQNLKYVREQIKISEGLLKDKLTTRYKHLGFLKEESSLVSRIEEDRAALDRSRSMLSSAREALAQISNQFHEQVQSDLRRARRELLEFSQRLRKMSDSLQRTVIRSPANGIVKTVYIMGEGEVVQPGMTVLDIVPADDKLVIEAHLPLGDIGYVQVGQPASVRLATGDARMFGNLTGSVRRISPDAITTPEGGTYYRVLVETESDHFQKGSRKYQLYPGMRLLVAIKTGERTVMEYLVYPYFDTLYHGLHER
ncbi:HlyD family type I secretion periplasmic adaptor subunit [Pseudodesulfovibrio cashew]|uniref:HlyD family type I secretion periplasmic adaptor subunit n=1 Tax=Pseudodesulfovibrio cashew TaxID=2678688 RepID=UPI001F554A9F|nr:HlyD family type I secretion periplasmic adaptor subunit [Pseudodesulfovibrio cashew]